MMLNEEIRNLEIKRPHVVIIGAGTTVAAIPHGAKKVVRVL